MQPPRRTPPVYWLAAAQQRLMNDLAEALAGPRGRAAFHTHVAQVSDRLQKTFRDADAIIVRDRLRGYRPDPCMAVLLVELIRPCQAHEQAGVAETHIVKVAIDPDADDEPPRRRGRTLADEWEGWCRCWPRGAPGDAILTMLHEGHRDEQNRLLTLRYQDAHAMLGAADLVPLEDAFLDCCVFGTPTVDSLAQTLTRLFVQLEQRFYQRSFVGRGPQLFRAGVEAPPDAGAARGPYLRQRLEHEWLGAWRDALAPEPAPPGEGDTLRAADRRRFRREALAALADRRAEFLDPCDYLRGVLAHPDRAPDLLCGSAHGDLHGRNALVGLADDEAVALALFDYEHLRPDNLIGWDFVKLETELKVRACARLFPGTLTNLAVKVHEFEKALAVATEQMHDHNTPVPAEPEGFPGGAPGQRLARLLLTVRQQAQRCLGVKRNRAREWLEEYYFPSACYGVYAARFETYRQQELVSVYVAAGTVARRLSWPWHGLRGACEGARQQAAAALGQPPAAAGTSFRARDPTAAIAHHGALEFLRFWVRAGVGEHREHVAAAAAELARLRVEFPHVLEIEEELVLAWLELGEHESADHLLRAMSARYTRLSEEGLCRFGSRYKRQVLEGGPAADCRLGDNHRAALRQALEYYERAYALRGNYYPGINVAALLYLLGEKERAAQIAGEVFAAAAPQPGDGPDDAVWKLATQAEARLWAGQAEAARQLYRQATTHAACRPQYRASMCRQLRLVLGFAPPPIRADWSEQHLNELFVTTARNGAPAASE